jgi:hypothetical protein
MPVTQQQPIFDAEEAPRFAVLWAGFDLGNSSDAEAKSKGNALRRMMAGKKFQDGTDVRLVDALELPEIRAALDAQMLPRRQPLADVAVLEEKLENLEEQLSESLNNNQILTDALTRLQGRQGGGFTGPLLSGFLALALAAECVVAVMGLFGGHEGAKHPEPVTAAMVAAATPKITPAEEKQEYRPDARPKAKPKPVPVVVKPEEPFPVVESSPVGANGRLRKTIQGFATVPVKPESKF